MNDIAEQYAYLSDAPGGPAQVAPGDTITSFRGEEWRFGRISQKRYGNSEGRIEVTRDCPDAYDNGHGGRECVHLWHRDGIETGWYYPSVFDLYLGLKNGDEA